MIRRLAEMTLASAAVVLIIGVLLPLVVVAKTVMLIADGLGCVDD